MAKAILTTVTGQISEQQLLARQLRELRLAMQDAIQLEKWTSLVRLDRLCTQVLNSLTPMMLNRDLAIEIIRIKELYRYLVHNVNRHLVNSVQAH